MPSTDELIAEANRIHPYDPSTGWHHDTLVILLHNHGVPAYREEFRSMAIDPQTGERSTSPHADVIAGYGIDKIACALESGMTVIVSIPKHFRHLDKPHLIPLFGTIRSKDGSLAGFRYHDPAFPEDGGGADQAVDLETFRRLWRRLAIFAGNEA